MDRGVPTEAVLAEMRASDPPVQYLVGTPKGRLNRLEKHLIEKPWRKAREGVEVKLLAQDEDLYVFAQSADRVAKERAMRRRQLKWLWTRLGKLAVMKVSYEEKLMKLGAARSKAPTAWRLIDVTLDKQSAALSYSLDRRKLRIARRREGRYLLRTNLTDQDPAVLWQYYVQLVAVDIDQTWRLSRIKRWRVWVDVGKQGATEWQGCCAGGFELGDCRRIRGDELVEGPLYFDRAAA
jgi:hypothetical protein